MKDGTSADSFVGSLISLTSKSEIRYEGILHSVDAENANISLQNVCMFGTEGRKMDGPQIPASGKVYDFIIFRGSDIKDLQVKSAAATQKDGPQPPHPHNDPAIISLQSHHSQAASVSPQFVPSAAVPITDLRSPYNGLQPSAFQNNLPLMYQPPVGLGTWGVAPSSENANRAGLNLPSMYWQGYYRTPGPHSQLQQQPLPSQFLLNIPPIPPAQEQKHPAAALPLSLGLLLPASLDSSQINKLSITRVSCPPSTSALKTSEAVSNASPPLTLDVSGASALSTCAVPSSVNISSSGVPESDSEWIRKSNFAQQQTEIIRSGTAAASANSATQATTTDTDTQATHLPHTSIEKLEVETEVRDSTNDPTMQQSSERKYQQDQKSSKALPSFPTSTVPENQTDQINGIAGNKTFGWKGQGRQWGRGRGRWRARGKGQGGIGSSHIKQSRQEFLEDFDFVTMNEKFKKEEVWGELGSVDKVANSALVERIPQDSGSEMPTGKASITLSRNVKPIYVKDDFFDTLSCDALDRKGGRVEHMKYSEQRKVDSETFGNTSFRSHRRDGRRRGSFRHSYSFDYNIHRGGNHSSERKDKNEYNARACLPSSSARSRQLEGYQ